MILPYMFSSFYTSSTVNFDVCFSNGVLMFYNWFELLNVFTQSIVPFSNCPLNLFMTFLILHKFILSNQSHLWYFFSITPPKYFSINNIKIYFMSFLFFELDPTFFQIDPTIFQVVNQVSQFYLSLSLEMWNTTFHINSNTLFLHIFSLDVIYTYDEMHKS